MTNVYVQGENGLIPLQGKVTAKSIKDALGYTPADAEDIIEAIEESDDSALYVTDKDGNIITRTDSEGFHAKAMTVNGKDVESGLVTDEDRESWGGSDLDDVISKDDDSTLYISDKDGNIIAKIDKDGLHTTEVYIGDESAEQTVAEMITKAVAGLDVDYTEVDPTVPDWAKHPTKPTYTAEEVGALPNTTPIPDVSGKLETSTFEDHEANLDKHLGGAIRTENDKVLYVCDKDGHIISKIDSNGIDAVQYFANGSAVKSIIAAENGTLLFSDGTEIGVGANATGCEHNYVDLDSMNSFVESYQVFRYCDKCGSTKIANKSAVLTVGLTGCECVDPDFLEGGYTSASRPITHSDVVTYTIFPTENINILPKNLDIVGCEYTWELTYDDDADYYPGYGVLTIWNATQNVSVNISTELIPYTLNIEVDEETYNVAGSGVMTTGPVAFVEDAPTTIYHNETLTLTVYSQVTYGGVYFALSKEYSVECEATLVSADSIGYKYTLTISKANNDCSVRISGTK